MTIIIFAISGLLCRGLNGISPNVSVLLAETIISGQVSHGRLTIKKPGSVFRNPGRFLLQAPQYQLTTEHKGSGLVGGL